MTYIVFNNENYALTTGQASATTTIGAVTKTTPEGNMIAPINPVALATEAGCKFSKRAHSQKFAELKEIIKAAIQHQ